MRSNRINKLFIKNLYIDCHDLIKNYKEVNKADIDLIVKGNSTYKGAYWQSELISVFNIYVKLIGAIDKRIDIAKRSIQNKDYCNELFEKREEIATRLLQLIGTYRFEIVSKKILEYPIYKKFDEIYKDSTIHHTQLDLHLQFINAYDSGYDNSLYLDFDKVLAEYNLIDIIIKQQRNDNEMKLKIKKLQYRK